MKILATIAARGGSKGIKNKNIKLLAGKPLIAYTIEQIKKWGKFSKFIVSTDSQEIKAMAEEYGAAVPFLRPRNLAEDTTDKMDALRHALRSAEDFYGIKFDAVLDLDATSPVRGVEDINNAVKLFEEKNADCVFSVVKARKNPYFNLVEENSDGTVALSKSTKDVVTRRQSAPLVFEMNASIYVYKRDFLLDENNKMPYSGRAYAYEMKESSAIDIDSEIDFRFIEFLIKEGIVSL